MYFKKFLFSFIAAYCFLLSLPALSINFQEGPCSKMASYYESLIRGPIPFKEREQLFHCLYDGVKLFIQRMGHDASRSYFTTEDVAKFYYHVVDLKPDRAWEMAVKSLVVKKILVGGAVDKLEDKKLDQLFHLIYDYGKFFTHIKREIPFFHSILTTGQVVSVSHADFEKSLKRLHNAFIMTGEAYKREKVSYSTQDFHQIGDYARVLSYNTSDFNRILRYAANNTSRGASVTLDFNSVLDYANILSLNPFDKKRFQQWTYFSDFLHFWGSGVFKTPVKGNRWAHFTGSFNHMLSLFAIYRVYVSGRDIFSPKVFSMVLKSFEKAIEAILYVRHNSGNTGFPADKFTGLIKTVLSQAEDSVSLSASPSASPLSHLTKEESGDSLSLITRALVCFSLSDRTSGCEVSGRESDVFSSFLFPDGKYVFYKNNTQEWMPFKNQTFSITPSQLQSLHSWLEDFRLGVDFIEIDKRIVANRYKFSHWLNGFFGYDKRQRVQFGSITGRASNLTALSYSLLNYAAFLSFFISSYVEWDFKVGNEAFVSPLEWKRFTNEMFPVLAVLFQIDYNTELKSLSPFLFEYGDLLLNSANKNGKLEFRELLDLTVHLVSAQKSSQVAFQLAQSACRGSLNRACVVEELFFDTNILDNFPHLRQYFVSHGVSDFMLSGKEILPETIKSSYDLLPFFLVVQLTEFMFYAYDHNNSSQIESQEFQEFIKGLREKITEKVPYVHNNKQSEAYLHYAVEKGNFPYLMEKGQIFSSIGVSHWILHPKEYKDLAFSRYQFFAFFVNFYNLNRQFN